jgi:hypothetical protein
VRAADGVAAHGRAAAFQAQWHIRTLRNRQAQEIRRMKLLVKHRYSHVDADTGEKLETRFHMTAEAAATSKMVKPQLIAESREEHYLSDSLPPNRFSAAFLSSQNR